MTDVIGKSRFSAGELNGSNERTLRILFRERNESGPRPIRAYPQLWAEMVAYARRIGWLNEYNRMTAQGVAAFLRLYGTIDDVGDVAPLLVPLYEPEPRWTAVARTKLPMLHALAYAWRAKLHPFPREHDRARVYCAQQGWLDYHEHYPLSPAGRAAFTSFPIVTPWIYQWLHPEWCPSRLQYLNIQSGKIQSEIYNGPSLQP